MGVQLPLSVPAFSSLCVCLCVCVYTPRGASQVVLVVKTLPVNAGDVGDAETLVQTP